MKIKNLCYIFTTVLCLFMLTAASTYAQTEADDDVKSLGDILNPQDDMAGALTPKEMANIYYKKCLGTESLAFDKQEKETLCACTSAHLGPTLTASEFKNLYKDNLKGKDARGKVIAYAYTECMDYVLKSKLYNDCMVSPTLRKVVRGKKEICECSAERYISIINKDASYIIMEALKHQPMTLNPLEHYFTTTNYGYMSEHYTQYCRSKMLYEKHN